MQADTRRWPADYPSRMGSNRKAERASQLPQPGLTHRTSLQNQECACTEVQKGASSPPPSGTSEHLSGPPRVASENQITHAIRYRTYTCTCMYVKSCAYQPTRCQRHSLSQMPRRLGVQLHIRPPRAPGLREWIASLRGSVSHLRRGRPKLDDA